MSKFSSYARKADTIARKALAELEEAESALKAAEDMQRQYPKHRVADAAYAVKAGKAELAVLEAKEKMKQTRASMNEYKRQIAAIKKDLSGRCLWSFQRSRDRLTPPL